MLNIKVADFSNIDSALIECSQFDYGQIVQLIGDEIAVGQLVQWSYAGITGVNSRAIYEDGGLFYAEIPDEALLVSSDFEGFIFIYDAEKGNTIYRITGRINERASTTEDGSIVQIPFMQGVVTDAQEATAAAIVVTETADSNEIIRQGNEVIRISQESERDSAEGTRASNEITRQSNEGTRVSQESLRVIAENNRIVYAPWDGITEWKVGNKVSHLGSSFVALFDNLNSEPPSVDWLIIASKGDSSADLQIDDDSIAVDKALSASYIKAQLSAIDSQLAQIATVVKFDAGVADYTTVLQAALDKAGLVRVIGAGTYITGRLQIGSNTILDLGVGVILKKKDGTNHNILTNKGRISGTRDKNITIQGGTYDLNMAGQSAHTGNLLTDPQSWSGQGILFHMVDGLTIKNIEQIGNEQGYCILIADATNVIIDNIWGSSVKDGIHLQPPFKNARINNIRGHFEDDMVSLTAGDYKAYSLGNYGDFENVEITNLTGEQYNASKSIWTGGTVGRWTDSFVKMVGSGLDNVSKFRNIRISNLSGGCLGGAIAIMREDLFDGNTALKDTVLENVIVENISLDYTSVDPNISVGAKSGDLTIRNIKCNQLYKVIAFAKADLDNVVIDGIYNRDMSAEEISVNTFIRVDNSDIKQMLVSNVALNLAATNAAALSFYIVLSSNSDMERLTFDNVKIESPNDDVVELYVQNTTLTSKIFINIVNCYLLISTAIMACCPTDVMISNSYIELFSTTKGFWAYDGALPLNIDASDNSVIKNFKTPTELAERKRRFSGKGIEYNGLLSATGSAKQGDIVNCTSVSEPMGTGLVFFDGTIWRRYTPKVTTQAVVLGTINAYSTKEVVYAIATSGPNKEMDCNPTFLLPDGLIFVAYNRDYDYVRLRVANVTNVAITVADGNWIFRER